MFWGIPSPVALESTAPDFRKQRHGQLPVLSIVSNYTSDLYLTLFSEAGQC